MDNYSPIEMVLPIAAIIGFNLEAAVTSVIGSKNHLGYYAGMLERP